MSAPTAPLKPEQVLVLFNGFLGMSGGDRHLLDMASHWSELAGGLTRIALPRLAEQVVDKEYLVHTRARFIDTPFERHAVSSTLAVSACYSWRTIACSLTKFSPPPKIIVASGHLPFDVIPAVVLSRRYRAKWVIYIFHLIQMQSRQANPRNTIAQLAEKLALTLTRRYASLVVTDNQTVQEQLVELGIASDRIHTTPLGIPLRAIQAAPSSAVQYQAVFFGRLVEHKGVFDLVDIWDQVVKSRALARLLIIGDGPARGLLERRFKEKGLERNVCFTGLVNPIGKVYELLKQSQLCLHPSHEEGWGISVCEAMACGLPVVAYDLPAFRSVFRQGMQTAPLGDRKGLADTALRLLSDKGARDTLRLAAVQQASEYDVNTVARRQWQWVSELAAL